MSPLSLHTFSKQSFWCAKDGIPEIHWLLESLCFGCFIHQFYNFGSLGNWKLQIAGEIVDNHQIYHENCHATYYIFWSDVLLDHGRKNFQNHMRNSVDDEIILILLFLYSLFTQTIQEELVNLCTARYCKHLIKNLKMHLDSFINKLHLNLKINKILPEALPNVCWDAPFLNPFFCNRQLIKK